MEDSRLSKTYAITLKEINNKNSKIFDQNAWRLIYFIIFCHVIFWDLIIYFNMNISIKFNFLSIFKPGL